VAALSAASLGVVVEGRRFWAPAPVRFLIDPPGASPITRLSLSPDGERVAFSAAGRLYVRELNRPESRYLEGTIGAGSPFWSPDGHFLAYSSANKLMKVAAAGGAPQVLCDVDTNIAGAWSPYGEILIGQRGDGIFHVPDRGGELKRVTEVNRAKGETRHLLPQFLPGGRTFLYIAGSDRPGGSMLYAASLDGGERTAVMPVDSNVAFASGHLFFLRDRALMAQAFDPKSLQRSGPAVALGGPLGTAQLMNTVVENGDFSAAGRTLAFRLAGGAMPGLMTVLQAARKPETRGITIVKNWAP
jgi:hypothetical protein